MDGETVAVGAGGASSCATMSAPFATGAAAVAGAIADCAAPVEPPPPAARACAPGTSAIEVPLRGPCDALARAAEQPAGTACAVSSVAVVIDFVSLRSTLGVSAPAVAALPAGVEAPAAAEADAEGRIASEGPITRAGGPPCGFTLPSKCLNGRPCSSAAGRDGELDQPSPWLDGRCSISRVSVSTACGLRSTHTKKRATCARQERARA